MKIATYTSTIVMVSGVNECRCANNYYHGFLFIILIIDIYFANRETRGMYVSEDVGSTSICVVSRATEELTAFIEDYYYYYDYGMFFILD